MYLFVALPILPSRKYYAHLITEILAGHALIKQDRICGEPTHGHRSPPW
jgi:hypothetical protein